MFFALNLVDTQMCNFHKIWLMNTKTLAINLVEEYLKTQMVAWYSRDQLHLLNFVSPLDNRLVFGLSRVLPVLVASLVID